LALPKAPRSGRAFAGGAQLAESFAITARPRIKTGLAYRYSGRRRWLKQVCAVGNRSESGPFLLMMKVMLQHFVPRDPSAPLSPPAKISLVRDRAWCVRAQIHASLAYTLSTPSRKADRTRLAPAAREAGQVKTERKQTREALQRVELTETCPAREWGSGRCQCRRREASSSPPWTYCAPQSRS